MVHHVVLERWSNGTICNSFSRSMSLISCIGYDLYVRAINTFHVLDKTSFLRSISRYPHWALRPDLVNNAWVRSLRFCGIVIQKRWRLAGMFQFLTENTMRYFGPQQSFGSSIEWWGFYESSYLILDNGQLLHWQATMNLQISSAWLFPLEMHYINLRRAITFSCQY